MPILNAKFELGDIVVTDLANGLLAEEQISTMLLRHLIGDWGALCPADWQENEFSIEHGFRILSKYLVDGEYYYVITEADRSMTTILLTEEY